MCGIENASIPVFNVRRLDRGETCGCRGDLEGWPHSGRDGAVYRPGDETALEKIARWIDASDVFVLILGGRYGSIEPTSGKSYVQLEYEYALAQRKPFASLVIRQPALEARMQQHGFKADEREHPVEYGAFRSLVSRHHRAEWSDAKDIKEATLSKMYDWSDRDDLVGWVRGDAAVTSATVAEISRLSRENHDLRERLAAVDDRFEGLAFDELVGELEPHSTGALPSSK
jgi:hypothetical protein